MKAAIYVRVSKKDQEFERQISDLKASAQLKGYEVTAVITEKVSGAALSRPGITELLALAQSKKISKVLVTEISRLGRKTLEVLQTLDKLTTSGVSVYVHNFGIETIQPDGKRNPMASMMFTILAEFAAMEREFIIDRVKSGLDQAKRNGKILGRPEGSIKSNDELIRDNKSIVRALKDGYSIRKTAKLNDVCPATVQKIKKLINHGS